MTSEWSLNHLAAQAVAVHGGGPPSERRELLEMLGLVSEDGQITPDDTRNIDIHPVGDTTVLDRVGPRVQEVFDRSNVPPGLRNLQPLPVEPRRITPSSVEPRETRPRNAVAKCGTLGGRARHMRLKERLCQPCKDAQNAYQREYKKRKNAAKAKVTPIRPAPVRKRKTPKIRVNPNLPPRPETCGTIAGRSNHLRRGQKMCLACATVYNTHQRAVRRSRAIPKELSA